MRYTLATAAIAMTLAMTLGACSPDDTETKQSDAEIGAIAMEPTAPMVKPKQEPTVNPKTGRNTATTLEELPSAIDALELTAHEERALNKATAAAMEASVACGMNKSAADCEQKERAMKEVEAVVTQINAARS